MPHYSYPPRDHDSGGWDSNSPYLGRATPPPHTPNPNRWLPALVAVAVLALVACVVGAVFVTHDSSNQPTTPPTATTTG